MGFPVGYTEFLLPKLFVHMLSVLGFLRKFLSTLFRCIGRSDFFEPDIAWVATASRVLEFNSMSAVLARDSLPPVVRFSELVDPPESCAVCLFEFDPDDDIRRLMNCRHIFHMGCLDRWMGYEQKTCPLCRTPFIPADMLGATDERLRASFPDFYGEYSQVTGW
ncbi:E3 ubiquitin-protein ligase RHA1B [Morella rubra]|uniref:E3 ubiquitin-protein ligase RHA1B n=1 Tax=Morella rubra TaxID=262757 RepID=A0A6A1VRT8_9ROSI|nr:E3 ubiquitin-protein ligase RHA1B [Morella rubra]